MKSLDFHARQQGAVILAEACASILLAGLVLTMLSLLLSQHSRATESFLNYHRAALAAQSCVERMRAGMLPVTDAVIAGEAGVTCDIQVTDADPVWQPLKFVRVTASFDGRRGRAVPYRLQTYVAPNLARPEKAHE